MESDTRNQQTSNDFKDAKLTDHRKIVLLTYRNTQALCGISAQIQKLLERTGGLLRPHA
jgi:hypothetical protein